METYMHTLNKREALLKIALADESEPEYQRAERGAVEGPNQDQQYSQEIRGFPAPMPRDDSDEDFSWYEEE